MAATRKENEDQAKLAQIIYLMHHPYESGVDLGYKLDRVKAITAILDSDFDVNSAVSNYGINKYGINEKYLGSTVLHLFTRETYNEDCCETIIKLFLSHGASFTCKNSKGFTPLRAVFDLLRETSLKDRNYKNNVSDIINMLKLLTLAHCDFNNLVNPSCDKGISHLHLACFCRNTKVVKLFLDAGVPVNQAINNDSSIWPGHTALHIAIGNKDIEMVELLMKYSPDCTYATAAGVSPLHLLNEKEFGKGFFSAVNEPFESESLKNRCILNLIYTLSKNSFELFGKIGLTPLHSSCIKNKGVKLLLKDNSDVNAAINFDSPIWPGCTPLHFAVHCNSEMVLLLLENGASLMAKDAKNVTPLDLCLKKYEPAKIGSILKKQDGFKSLQLQNGSKLVDVLRAFSTTRKLTNYLKRNSVNAALPTDCFLWPGFTLLHLAVMLSKGQDTSAVKLCLKKGADFTIQDANRMTALHLAFRLNKHECVNRILIAHANNSSNPVDDKNVSHFHIACTAGCVKTVENFLSAGLNPDMLIQSDLRDLIKVYLDHNEENNMKIGLTPLQNTVFFSTGDMDAQKDYMRLFLKFKADPNLPDSDGFTWIHRTFMCNKSDKFDDILWNHPETFKSNRIAPGGLSYFHIACFTGNLDAIKALAPLTENINEPITSELLKYKKECRYGICPGDTPLHLAIKKVIYNKFFSRDPLLIRASPTVIVLVENNADVKTKNAEGLTPLYQVLHELHKCFCEDDDRRVIKYLARDLFKSQCPDECGLTRLHIACVLRDESLIQEFLGCGDDLCSKINSDSKLWPSYTPFDVFIKYDYMDNSSYTDVTKFLYTHILKLIESLKSDDQEYHELSKHKEESTKIANLISQQALRYSCRNDISIVEKFIKSRVDINAAGPCEIYWEDDYGTALHVAVDNDNKEMIEILLEKGADISLKSTSGQTPLHIAALHHPETLETFFKRRDIDVKMKNAHGQTIIDCVCVNKSADSTDFMCVLKHKSANNMDFLTKMSIIKISAWKFSGEEFELILGCLRDFNGVDAEGRNVFHHLSSLPDDKDEEDDDAVNKSLCPSNIESIMLCDCELDHQDRHGQTPLHLAVINQDVDCVDAFLPNGADVNVIDNVGKTAFMYCHELDDLCQKLSEHICKMRDAGLHVQPDDKVRSIDYDLEAKSLERRSCLSMMSEVEISKSFSLRDVLTEQMVMMFPIMPLRQRQAIREYLKCQELPEDFREWEPLFKMQLRKALRREKMFKPAVASLLELLDQRLPVLCIESILIHLSTKDWSNVMQAERDF